MQRTHEQWSTFMKYKDTWLGNVTNPDGLEEHYKETHVLGLKFMEESVRND